jgi:alkanesulfonate monooxygenase SsuD/methylene tetrahydromethanopterin reductase-like flavin-dependent oxidoreductase (luciferase family)
LAYQNGGPPVIVGGTSEAAYRRAIQKGHGWYGFALNIASSQESIDAIRSLSDSTDRGTELGELEISITPRVPLTDEIVKQFEDMGVSRLILLQTGKNEDQMLEYIDQVAKDFF